MSLSSFAGGFRLFSLPEIDSTNTEARRRAAAGEAPGFAVTAAVQTGGLGRQGRSWLSPAGNLYVSTLVKPELPASRLGQLAFASAVAVADMLDARLGSGRTQLKWPNDILVDDAKLGGILIESELVGDQVAWVVIGIGLNIAVAPENPAYPTTCLDRLTGLKNPLPQLLDDLLANLAGRLVELEQAGFAAIRTTWESRAWRLGQPVKIRTGTEEVQGSFTALAEDGALLLATPTGQARITAGSLAYESAA